MAADSNDSTMVGAFDAAQSSQTTDEEDQRQTISQGGVAIPSSSLPGHDHPSQGAQDEDYGIAVNASDMHDGLVPAKKKKKRSKKPASKRGLGKPTGFEEFHADGPLTPEQYEESREIFHPDIPFVDRILKAIQRFERTRKLSPERRNIFYKYLAYGGVDVGPNMFVGGQDTEDMDKDELSITMAQANISDNTKQAILDPKNEQDAHSTGASVEASKLHCPENAAKYVVDFEATMRSFLSRQAPSVYVIDNEEHVNLITTTLERFMDYLLQHEVCPEYTVEVLVTRDLCRNARKELWQCLQAQRQLPGDFNIACSTLFGGRYSQNYDGETYWGSPESKGDVFVGLKTEQATQIVGFAIAGAASEEVYHNYLDITAGESEGKGFEIVTTIEDHGFEIVRIEQPSRECKTLYRENTSEFRPVGRMTAKFFSNPEAPPEDLTLAEKAAMKLGKGDMPQDGDLTFVFFIESEPLLSLLQPGMRVEATIHELNCGIWFFDEVVRVLPAFDLWLENELMLGWKEPRPVAGVPPLTLNPGADIEEEAVEDVLGETNVNNGENTITQADDITTKDLDEDGTPIVYNGESSIVVGNRSEAVQASLGHGAEEPRPY